MWSGGQTVTGSAGSEEINNAAAAAANAGAGAGQPVHHGGGGGGGGGGGISAADKAELNDLQNRQDEQQDLLAGLSQAQQHAVETANDIGQDAGIAQSTLESKKAGAEAAGRQLDEYNHGLDDQARQLDIAKNNWESALRLAQFFRDHAINELREDKEQALLEAWYEARNNMWEAFCTAIASIMHMGIAIAGGVSPKNAVFDRHQYLRVEKPEEDQSPQYFAQAQSQRENFQKQKEYLEQKENDSFYAGKAAEAEAEFAGAEARYHDLDAQRDEARADAEAAADSVYDAQRVLRDIGKQIRDLYAKYGK
jgi:hypothetical protein